MDPNRGTLYPSLGLAHLAGVVNPVELTGSREDIERISTAVQSQWTREQKARRKAKNRAARASRRANRS